MGVGKEIRRLREERGWSQAKLAGASDMGTSGISQIETGTRNPSAVTLSKIADALGVEVADLFPKPQRHSSLEPSLNDALEEERRAAWEAAVNEAQRLRETGWAQMWRALSEWRASKKRGEPFAARREYLDEMGNLLQEVYDADEALGRAYIKATLTTPGASEASFPSYLQEEARMTGHFYGELLGLVKSARLSVLTGDDATAAKQAAKQPAEQPAAEHVQPERPRGVEEPRVA